MPELRPASEGGAEQPGGASFGSPGTGAGSDVLAELERLRSNVLALAERFEDVRTKYNSHTHLSRAQFSGNANGSTVPAASTHFLMNGHGGTSATSADTTLRVPSAYTLGRFYVRTTTAQPGDGALTITVLVNGVPTALVVTIPAGGAASLYSNLVNTVAVAAGDTLLIRLVNASPGTVSAALRSFSMQWEDVSDVTPAGSQSSVAYTVS